MRRRDQLTVGLALLGVAWLLGPTTLQVPPEPPQPSGPHPATVGMLSPDAAVVEHTTTLKVGVVASAVHTAPVYLPTQRLVRLTDPSDLLALTADHDVRVLRPVGQSGYALLEGDPTVLDALTHDPRVAATHRNATTHGASGASRQMQWHLDAAQVAYWDASAYVIAVLDTGVAYETAQRDGVAYVQAPSLSSSAIAAPYDFVNEDPHANDDHQHGTHIASVIAADGVIHGTAPGATLMPVKVLDEHNQGTEFDLVEGLWHAVANGADVINLSLSFGEGYEPSQALQEALQAAHDAGIVMVGAAGNDGSHHVTWPAASPLVMAVGASVFDDGEHEVAGYSNVSSAIDLLAPGGSILHDYTGDGLVDGILAETIAPGDPTSVGYWLVAGTSQAAAQVSGLAALALDGGAQPSAVPTVLQRESEERDFEGGLGAGFIELEHTTYLYQATPGPDMQVVLLPYVALENGGTELRPKARLRVLDQWGGPPPGERDVLVTMSSQGNGILTCQVDASDDTCVVSGEAVPRFDAAGEEIPWAWSVQVHGVTDGYVVTRPTTALAVTDALVQAVEAIDAEGDLTDAALGWSFGGGSVTELGDVVSDSLSVVDSGSGLASIPLGLMLTRRAANALANSESRTLSLSNGGQLETSLLTFDGSGLASIPLGLQPFRLLAMNGSGLASIPLGHTPQHPATPISLRNPSLPGGLQNTPLGNRLLDGGWRVDGYGAASAIGSSATLGIAPNAVPWLDGAGMGETPLP
ncbi:MAG: S8 family serine peptidase [Myxococcales bacterium]|nr:S8 family serine peptidase [Myxococcales bacterium]